MEERRFILAIISISLAALATTEEAPSPPPTENGHISARAPPPPPPPPKPHLPNNTLLHPQVLGDGQCDVGAVNSSIFSASRYADAGRLYVDTGQPAQCSGEVIRLEICYIVFRSGPGSSTSTDQSTIIAAVLRRDTNIQGYLVTNVHDINVENDGARGSSEGYLAACDFIDFEDAIFMERGDFLGFVCEERVRIVFTSTLQDQTSSSPGGMIKVFNLSSVQRDTPGTNIASYLLEMSSVRGDQFESINESVTPLLRIIMNVTNDTSTTDEVPTTVRPTTIPCSGDGEDLFRNTIFIIVLAAASAIIFVLLLLVLILSCCLCKMKFWCCYKLHSCCGDLFLPCHKRNHVVHRIKVEPMSVGLEQSMQYNELYVPSNHNQRDRMSQCRGEFHRNPAYTPNGSKANGIDEVDRAVDSGVSEGIRGLEHTYEMIDTIR